MAQDNDQLGKPELGSRYGKIGISALAAALRYKSEMKIGSAEHHRAKKMGSIDAVQKSDGVGNSGQMRSSRPRNR
jgi:hypothetical protein